MTVSSLRTVFVQALAGPGVPVAWPLGEPGELLDYSADVTGLLGDAGGDSLVSVSLAIRPSGAGECQAASLAVAPSPGAATGIITAMLPGGPAGRKYVCRFDCATAGGRTFEFLVGRPIDPALALGRAKSHPPSVDFGAPVTWNQAPFALNNGYVVVVNNPGFSTSDSGLWAGACWDNGGFLCVMPGATPNPAVPPFYLGSVTANQFLWYGGGYLPVVSPPRGSGILWNNEGFVCAA